MREGREVEEIEEVREKNEGVAAFFDVDGTLMTAPSLEKRFFRMLRYQEAIPAKNYFLWLKEALRLLPRGIRAIVQANKMYLRGVQVFDERGEGDGEVSFRHTDGHQAQGRASDLFSKRARRIPRLPVPVFFAEAMERAAWHAKQGHQIVLISGTLEPLARGVARAMQAQLATRGITTTIRFCATRLEEKNRTWTGQVLGEAMFGEAKARAAKRLAGEMRLDLARCYAYGDSTNDRWLLDAAGKPVAVNPSKELAQIAKARGWPVLHWKERAIPAHRRGERSVSRRKQSTRAEWNDDLTLASRM